MSPRRSSSSWGTARARSRGRRSWWTRDRPPDVPARLIPRLARLVAEHPLPVLVTTLAIVALCAVPASRLSIRSDLAALLPDDGRSARAYRAFLESFGGIENVYVLVRV